MYKEKRSGWFFKFLLMTILLSGIAYGGYFLYEQQKSLQGKYYALAKDLETQEKSVKVAPRIIPTGKVSATTWMDVQRQTKNTVVKIISSVAAFNWLEPYKTPEMGEGSGSGFFINANGDIVTNYHVVNQARSVHIEIPVIGADRLDVEVVGVSPERDLALLRLTDESRERIKKELNGIPFLKFGDSDKVQRGQDVLALGYPLGVQTLKSTQGIVSGRERIKIINRSCLQTTAPLNPGNSGGPSVNSSGEVIGINFAGVVQAQNVGYIIPINDVKSAIKDLYKVKLLRRPVLGCALEGANEDLVAFLDNPLPGGFYITRIFKNTILEKVEVQAGDMIYEVNGFKLNRFGQATVPWNDEKVSMLDILDRLEVGDKVDLVIYRKGERKEIDFALEPRFLLPIRHMYPDFEKIDYETIAGLVVMDLTRNHVALLAEHAHGLISYESPENQYDPALVISYIQPTSLAFKLRLIAPGKIVEKVNGVEVKTLPEFRNAVKKSKSSGYLTVETKDNWLLVFKVENIVKDEVRLSKLYSFKESSLIDEIA